MTRESHGRTPPARAAGLSGSGWDELAGCSPAPILNARRRLGQQDRTQRIETSRREDGEQWLIASYGGESSGPV